MATTNRGNTCRLAPLGESGRIRWCVGHEQEWRLKLKILVFVPILLLSITAIALLFTHVAGEKREELAHVSLDELIPNNRYNNDISVQHDPWLELQSDEIRLLIKTRDIKYKLPEFDTNPEIDSMEDSKSEDSEEIQVDPNNILLHIDTVYVSPHRIEIDPTDEISSWSTRIKRHCYENMSDIFEGEEFYWGITRLNYTNKNVYKNISYEELDSSKINLVKQNNHGNLLQKLFWRNNSTKEEVRQIQAEATSRYMDTSVDPCVDFYQYACGNWVKYHPIPPDKIRYDMFEVLRESLDLALRDVLEDNNIMDNDHQQTRKSFSEDAVTKTRNFYKSCMNEELIKQRGEKPLVKLLKELGGWPIIDPNWKEEKFDWISLMGYLRLYNNDILISELVGPDIRNASEFIIQVDQTTLGLPSKMYFLHNSNLKYLDAYRTFMISIANLLGSPVANATENVDDMIKFETNLASIIESPEGRRNISEEYVKVTIGELHELIPEINWFRYFSIILRKKIHLNSHIVLFCMDYLKQLVTLINKTPPRTVANYLLWRFVRNRINNLDNRFRDVKQRFYYVLFGREKSPPRWQTCVSQVNSHMGMALGYLFVDQYFDEESKNDTLQIAKELQQAFRELISDTKWLDNETKNLAMIKIDAMHLLIGYPNFIINHNHLTQYYRDIEIDPDLYFENTLSILEHLNRKEHSKLGTVVNKLTWTTPPAIVNAYYSRNKNQIMFPAGILQPPFYQRYFPRSLNYGGIGVVIGHEVTHGFDDTGRLFDKEGNLHRWWKVNDVLLFHEKAQCLIEQYNKFRIPEIDTHVDGRSTKGENIADNGALKQAYKAYTKWLENNQDAEENLPNLNLSNRQLFFLHFAQVWCGSFRTEGLANKLKRDVHAPGRYRVIGTLSNFNEFSHAFKCPLGSPMNPTEKCTVW